MVNNNKIINPEEFYSRNRFLAFMLFVTGLIQFSTTTRSAKHNVYLSLYSSAAFFAMFGGLMALFVLHLDNYNNVIKTRPGQIAIFITCFCLYVAFTLIWAQGVYVSKKRSHCNEKSGCVANALGSTVIIPAFVSVCIAIDMYYGMFNHRITRLLCYSLMIFVTSICMIIYYEEVGSAMTDGQESALSGFVFLMLASCLSLASTGIIKDKLTAAANAIFNFVTSFIYFIGVFMVLAYEAMPTASIVVWWFLLTAIVYLICADLAADGTIKLRKRIRDSMVSYQEKREEKHERANNGIEEEEPLKQDDEKEKDEKDKNDQNDDVNENDKNEKIEKEVTDNQDKNETETEKIKKDNDVNKKNEDDNIEKDQVTENQDKDKTETEQNEETAARESGQSAHEHPYLKE